MALAKTMVLTTLALAVLAFTAVSSQADTYHHIDTLAVKVQAKSQELIKEIGLHYRHKAGYHHLRSDAIQLYQVAAHIHSVAHCRGSIHHLQEDLAKADRLFHHLEGVLARTDRSCGGHSHGATRHVFELMHALEDCLHHLKSDIDSLDAAAHHNVSHRGSSQHRIGSHGSRYAQTWGLSNTGYGHHSYGYSSRSNGISVNNGRWTFRFGF